MVDDAADADRFRLAGLVPVVEAGRPDGLDTAMAVLAELGIDNDAVALWGAAASSSGRLDRPARRSSRPDLFPWLLSLA